MNKWCMVNGEWCYFRGVICSTDLDQGVVLTHCMLLLITFSALIQEYFIALSNLPLPIFVD